MKVACSVRRGQAKKELHNHLVGWLPDCPGHQESADKRQHGRSRPGNKYVKAALVQAAHATAHTKTYLREQSRRLRQRRGAKRAAIAVGHSILIIFYHMMTTGESHHEKGVDFFEHRERGRLEKWLVQRLQQLGYQVSQPRSPASAL